jgi:hypothetical protein|eukprot:3423681-Prymnesium_polylepis.1
MSPIRGKYMSGIHTLIYTVSRLFRAISRAVSRYFADFADGHSQDSRLFHARCSRVFPRVIRVSCRVVPRVICAQRYDYSQ